LLARFPDGVIRYTFYGHPSMALVFQHIVRSYDEDARDISADAAHRLLGRKQVLILLDGAEEANNLEAVLNVAANCGLLITSRRRQDAPQPKARQDVRPLAAGDAVQLLAEWCLDQIDDASAAQRICELVGYLPLALQLVGSYLAATNERASAYLVWLEKTPLQALDPDGEQRRKRSVPYLLQRSVDQVGGATEVVLAVIGLLELAPWCGRR
jgi:hypothetical protein